MTDKLNTYSSAALAYLGDCAIELCVREYLVKEKGLSSSAKLNKEALLFVKASKQAEAMKNILPTLGNEFIALVKDTSVVSFVAAVDLYKTFTEIGNIRYEYLMPYLAMAIVYITLVMLISLGVKLLEKRLKKNERTA